MVPVKLSYFYIGYVSSPLNFSDFRMYVSFRSISLTLSKNKTKFVDLPCDSDLREVSSPHAAT